jgi:hypothetical protein
MNNKTYVLSPGVQISIENDNVVPDTTVDAGPDQIKLYEDAQKPDDSPAAEYDADEYVDVPVDVEKANESTFFGVILRRRSQEAFAKTKAVFPSADAFFKSNECKQGVAVAKNWAEKKKMTFASAADAKTAKQKPGIQIKSIGGATLSYYTSGKKGFVDIYFKNKNGKTVAKKFAVIKIGSSSESFSQEYFNNILFGLENDEPVDEAFAGDTQTEAPAVEETPVTDEAGTEVTPEEVTDAAETTESFIGALSRVLRSREEAEADAEDIDDEEIDDVVGDGEGDSVEESDSEDSEDEDEGSGGEEESEETKALESFYSDISNY